MAQKTLKLIIFLFFLVASMACNDQKDPFADVRKAKLMLSNGVMFSVTMAITPEEQQQGLSGLRNEQFPDEEGMFFYYESMSPKRFWMPDTYFNLDIFFINDKMQVIAVERNVPAHPGRDMNPPIAQTQTYYAKHVLELKASSKIGKLISVGDQLSWENPSIPSQIESKIRQKK
ncbi:MAG: hypothetical protein Fur0010_01430 [Bdellovibrio sp.]